MAKRPIVREFIWKYDDDLDNWGWALKGVPNFNAVSEALGVYHDALEHLSYGAEFSDELQAFGAMLFFRYEGGFRWSARPQLYRLPVNIGYDVASFLVDQLDLHGIADIAPITGRPVKSLDSTNDVIETAIQECLQTFHKQLAMVEWESQLQDVTPEELAEIHRRVEHWMRVGYLRCARRWQGDTDHAVLTATRICADVSRLTVMLDRRFGVECVEGARLKVRYWPVSGEHDVKVYFDGSNIANRW